jgi:transposase InsO family protein
VVDSIAPKRPNRPLVAPSPPDRSFSELVKQQVRNMAMAGFGGSLRISQTLAIEGLRLSRSTVRRWTKESSPACGPGAPGRASVRKTPAKTVGLPTISESNGYREKAVEKTVRAKRPNHVLMVDVTLIKALMGFLSFRLAVVIDVFSRFPLAFHLFTKEPSASDMECVLDEAVARARRLHPNLPLAHFVTDKGACFTAESFQAAVTRHGMRARFGAIGRHGSIALIERLWLGLKDLLQLRLDRRILGEDLQPRIALGLFYYAVLKPHQGLGGSTPAEVYFQKAPARLSAIPPPLAGNETTMDGFAVRYLDSARRLPVLMKKAA